MRYKIAVGNDYIESRLLTADELDHALETLRDLFDDRMHIMSIYHESIEQES